MLSKKCSQILLKSKNLLALSCGVDSTALFFILIKCKIEFDIAIVDYNKRAQSKDEIAYAFDLAKRYNKTIYSKSVTLSDSNFESEARAIRYQFFEEIISKHNYQNLLTAHQLNDKFEWFLMQLSKGASLDGLLGLREIESRTNYNLIRPLLNYTKDDLREFLKLQNIRYFIDESNFDSKYLRNYFRSEFADKFLNEFSSGVKRSFEYLEIERDELFYFDVIKRDELLFILKDTGIDINSIWQIDKILKKEFKLLISKAQRDEILKSRDCVIAGKVAIVFANSKIYIAPYIQTKMKKEFKEMCRIDKIPPKIRGYIYTLKEKF